MAPGRADGPSTANAALQRYLAGRLGAGTMMTAFVVQHELPLDVYLGFYLTRVRGAGQVQVHTSSTEVLSSVCVRAEAIRFSVNFDIFTT